MEAQMISFLTALCIGLILGIIFDFFRVIRSTLHLKMIATHILDALYWIISIGIAFGLLILINWGELRFYIFLGIILGAGVYYKLISRYMMYIFFRAIHVSRVCIVYVNKTIRWLIINPIAYFIKVCLWPFKKIKKCCKIQNVKDE